MTRKIFISYRRDDSAAFAGRVYDRLLVTFGAANLFMDVDAIPYGANFVKVLNDAIGQCDALLAVMGPSWLKVTDTNGRKRLQDPKDFVRLEIASALRRGIKVIPVLSDGTNLPRSEELPTELADLVLRNAINVRHASFHSDMQRLIRVLQGDDQDEAIGQPFLLAQKFAKLKSKIIYVSNYPDISAAFFKSLVSVLIDCGCKIRLQDPGPFHFSPDQLSKMKWARGNRVPTDVQYMMDDSDAILLLITEEALSSGWGEMIAQLALKRGAQIGRACLLAYIVDPKVEGIPSALAFLPTRALTESDVRAGPGDPKLHILLTDLAVAAGADDSD